MKLLRVAYGSWWQARPISGRLTLSLLALLLLLLGTQLARGSGSVQAGHGRFATLAFQVTWNRTDQLVEDGRASRSFLWGPLPYTVGLEQEYAESPGGIRLVQYFDKSRMEITNPNANKSSRYYVTNGLLARELMTGQVQIGDAKFKNRAPAYIGVAGDPLDTLGPTYAGLGRLLGVEPNRVGGAISQTIDREGKVETSPAISQQYPLSYARFEAVTGHNIATPFWDYLNETGPVLDASGQLLPDSRVFDPVFYATGLPITEAYWAKVTVAGQVKDVLVQGFERRVLTFTPTNPPAYRVEMGNVGLHHYRWYYNVRAEE